MVAFNIECDLPFSRRDFWRLRASPAFLSFIVEDGLLKKMHASDAAEDAQGWETRVQHYCPAKVDCPDFIRAVIGDTMFEVDDHQRWHDELEPFQLQFRIKPSFLATLSKTHGTLRVDDVDRDVVGMDEAADLVDASSSAGSATDPDGSDNGEVSDTSDCEQNEPASLISSLPPGERCVHVVSGETRVSILTVGWFVERAIVHNLKNFYAMYPASVMRFRQKLYAEFAEGDESVECSVVVDRLLERDLQERRRMEMKARANEWKKEDDNVSDLELQSADEDWDDVE